jgi:hypothetical protein
MKNTWIVLQHNPLDIEYLEDIQRSIKRAYPDFKRYTPEKFHMTLFHFGFPSTIYKDLTRAKQGMPYEAFERNFTKLVKELNLVKSTETVVSSTGVLENFGPNGKGKLVLRFVNSPELKKKREPYLTIINDWFEHIGIKKPEVFMRSTKNFKHNDEETYKPHVTIGYSPREFKKVNLPEKDERFGKAYLTNFDKLF